VDHSNTSYQKLNGGAGIPPTVVGGLFNPFLRRDLKYPPTAVGGIRNVLKGDVCRKDLNKSTHYPCVGFELSHPLPVRGI
jgi:hypothetical protein